MKNPPLKKLIPMIPKIKRKRNWIMMTFTISGIAEKSAESESLRPSFLLITLSGLSTRNSRNILMIFIFPLMNTNEAMETKTIKKSTAFHKFFK